MASGVDDVDEFSTTESTMGIVGYISGYLVRLPFLFDESCWENFAITNFNKGFLKLVESVPFFKFYSKKGE